MRFFQCLFDGCRFGGQCRNDLSLQRRKWQRRLSGSRLRTRPTPNRRAGQGGGCLCAFAALCRGQAATKAPAREFASAQEQLADVLPVSCQRRRGVLSPSGLSAFDRRPGQSASASQRIGDPGTAGLRVPAVTSSRRDRSKRSRIRRGRIHLRAQSRQRPLRLNGRIGYRCALAA